MPSRSQTTAGLSHAATTRSIRRFAPHIRREILTPGTMRKRLHTALARWATAHLAPADRARATVYTSGEHCAMCAAAHGWVGLGRIVYATSSAQLADWLAEWHIPRGKVRDLSIQQVLSGAEVDGPAPELAAEIHEIHRQFFQPRAAQ